MSTFLSIHITIMNPLDKFRKYLQTVGIYHQMHASLTGHAAHQWLRVGLLPLHRAQNEPHSAKHQPGNDVNRSLC